MKIYKTEREFEDELIKINELASTLGESYYRRYLGNGIFEFLITQGNTIHSDTWYVALKIVDNKPFVVKKKWYSSHRSEVHRLTPDHTVPDPIGEWRDNVDTWVNNRNRHWRRYYPYDHYYGIELDTNERD